MAAAGLDGAAALGGGATTRGLPAASGGACVAGAGPVTPGLGDPAGAAGAIAPTAGLAPDVAGAAEAGGVARRKPRVRIGRARRHTTALGGAGGVPLAPGTGSALVLGKDWFGASTFGAFAGCVAFGDTGRSARQTGFHRRIDRSAWRHRQFALLDQRGLLRDGGRQHRRGAALPRRHRHGRRNDSPVGPGTSLTPGTAPGRPAEAAG